MNLVRTHCHPRGSALLPTHPEACLHSPFVFSEFAASPSTPVDSMSTLGFCVLQAHPHCRRRRTPFFIKVNKDSMMCVYMHCEAGLEYVIPQLCLPGRHPLTFICKEQPFSFLGALNVPLWPTRFLLKNPVGTSRVSLI